MRIKEITEAFDSIVPYTWQHHGNETIQEYIAEFQLDDGHYMVVFKEKYYERGVWEFSFVRNKGFDLSATGRAATVLSTVMQIAREFIKTVDPRWFIFSGKNAEASRNKLYPLLIARMQREFPQYTLSTRQNRIYTKYDLERPTKPFVAPEPEPAEPESDMPEISWEELEAFMDELEQVRR